MRPIAPLLIAAAALLASAPTLAADAPLALRKAKVILRKPGKHRVKLQGLFDGDVRRPGFDPFADLIRVRVGGATVLTLPADGDRTGLRFRSHGRYRYKAPDLPRSRAQRMDLDLSGGRIKVDVRGLDLSALPGPESGELPVALQLGDTVYELGVLFRARGKRWTYRNRGASLDPSPGGGGPGGGGGGGGEGGGEGGGGGGEVIPDVPDGPVARTALLDGTSSAITAPENAAVADQAAWNQLWQRHAPGTTPPSVDFTSEMVLATFLGNRGPGVYSVGITAVTSQSNQYAVTAIETAVGLCRGTNVVVQPFSMVRVPRTPGSTTFTVSLNPNPPVCKRPE